MAEYLSRPRIEGPIWLESSDISFLQTQLSETETHIEDLEKQISELMRQKDAKVLERDSIQNILSPIRRAPVEILSEILELSCLPEDGIFSADYDLFRHASAVSRVCVAWRKAAHSTPRIWSKICLSVRKHEMVLLKLGLFMAGITEWIVRSQGLPLDVYLNYSDLRRSNALQVACRASEFLDCILDFSHQTRSIHLTGSRTTFLPLFRLPCSSLPVLEKVFLVMCDLGHEGSDRIEAFQGAPRLQHVSIHEIGYASAGTILNSLMLPVEQLTSLVINSRHWNTGFDLAQAKNLVSFTLDSPEFGVVGVSLTLPALRILDVSIRDIPNNPLQALTTPLLEDLTLRWLTQDIRDLARDVIAFQNRSSAALSSLTLEMYSGIQMNPIPETFPEYLISILAAFPTVRTFRVHEEKGGRYPTNFLLRVMIYTKGQPVVLPKLTNFELLAMEPYPSDLASMISSRRWPEPDVKDDSDGVLQLQNVALRCSDSQVG